VARWIEDDDETRRRNWEAFEDFRRAEPFRNLAQRLEGLKPPTPHVPSARKHRDPIRQKKARDARLDKVGRAFRQWHATPVTVTVADVLEAIEACRQAAQYAQGERGINNLVARYQRARAIWNGDGNTNQRARRACNVLFGNPTKQRRGGPRPIDPKLLRYAWADFTTCEVRRPAVDNLVGFEWHQKTWADLRLEPPSGVGAGDRVIDSMPRLSDQQRRRQAVGVIRALFQRGSDDACLKALSRAGIDDLPAMRPR
jgi:hypothetical protein